MKTSENKVVKHSTIYMFGDILRYSTSLIMLPIYTRFLTPDDYGVIELLTMLIDFTALILGARISVSVFRYYCTATNCTEKNNIISSALMLGIFFNATGAAILLLLSETLAIAIFSDASFQYYIVIFAITMLLLPLIEVPLVHIRAQQKPWLFFYFSIAKLVLQVGLNIYFIVYLDMHVEGVAYSAAITSIVMATTLTGYSLSKTGMSASIATCRKLFTFSLPLMLASLGTFYLTFGDRYILSIYTDFTQVGIYALGYKFGFIFMILSWVPFEKIWDSEKYEIHKRPNAKATYQSYFLYVNIILITLGLCISLFIKDLIKIMADPAFLNAHQIVPIIILAFVLQAWTKFCDLGILLKKKTMQIAQAELIAVIVMSIAFFTLIPAYGFYGAAWSAVIGFGTKFYWTYIKAKKLYDMELPWFKVNLTVLLAITFFLISLLIPDEIITSIALRLVLISAFIAAFFALPIFSQDEKAKIMQSILTIKNHPLFSSRINK
ncbi:oligosaccharide flippase family protein [Cardiobacterium sp. AH-315-I02]|nr:oligosaccharide flippase family protein [Cardiobacterium sp. AH-315-I02]